MMQADILLADRPKRAVRMDKRAEGAALGKGDSPRRFLIVEDEVFVRMDIEESLLAAGYDVVGAVDNAAEALAVAETEEPDLVLMDVRIAGKKDGVDTALELWSRLGIRCLFVSANLDEGVRKRAAEAQPWGFLPKPFTMDDLLRAVSSGDKPV